MMNSVNRENTKPSSDDEDDIDEFNARIIISRPDKELAEDESIETAYTFSNEDDDDFRLDGLSDDFTDTDIYRAADEELSIVRAYEIGIGYGLDEEELAQLTGRPD